MAQNVFSNKLTTLHRLKSPVTSLIAHEIVQINIKENIIAPQYYSLLRGIQWWPGIPLTKGQ